MFIFKELATEEKTFSKKLWQKVFTEDSKEFINEYYRGRCENSDFPENRIYAITDDIDGSIASMIHLNPYRLSLGATSFESIFIVGVATHPGYRKKGFMKSLMQKVILLAEDMHLPFIYLTTENEKLYTPFGFETVEYQYEADINTEKLEELINASTDSLRSEASNLTSSNMVTTLRDNSFYVQYEKELAADNGFLIRLEKNACIAGYFTDEPHANIKITDTYGIPHDLIKQIFTPLPVRSLMVKIIDKDVFSALLTRAKMPVLSVFDEKEALKCLKFNISEPV